MKFLRNYKYKNLTLVFASILLTIFLSKFELFNQILFNIRNIPFLGSFIAGILYVSTSTAALGILIINDLSKTHSPLEISIVVGLGASFADLVLFRFFKDGLLGEIKPIYNKFGGRNLNKIMQHKYVNWSLPLIGAFIIASPLPDEVGIGLMGLTKIKNYQFFILCLFLDMGGIFLLSSAFSLAK